MLANDSSSDPEQIQNLRRYLGVGLFNLGQLDLDDNPAYAEDHFKSSATVFEELAAADPTSLEFQKQLTVCYQRMGQVLAAKAKLDEARQCYEKAIARAESLSQQNPTVVDYASQWAAVLLDLFELESKAGDTAAALSSLRKARDILTPLVQKFPTVVRCQQDLAATLRELATMEYDAGDAASARSNLNEALRIVRDLQKDYTQQFAQEQFLVMEVMSLRKLAVVESGTGDGKAARADLDAATSIMRQLVEKYGGEQNQFDLALTLRELALELRAAGEDKSAGDHLKESIHLLGELAKQFPNDAEYAEELKKTKPLVSSSAPDSN